MLEFNPVATLADFHTLDETEILIGYMDGVEGRPLTGELFTRSYFHGWRNGTVDAGIVERDLAQETLAAAFRALREPETFH